MICSQLNTAFEYHTRNCLPQSIYPITAVQPKYSEHRRNWNSKMQSDSELKTALHELSWGLLQWLCYKCLPVSNSLFPLPLENAWLMRRWQNSQKIISIPTELTLYRLKICLCIAKNLCGWQYGKQSLLMSNVYHPVWMPQWPQLAAALFVRHEVCLPYLYRESALSEYWKVFLQCLNTISSMVTL